LYGHSYGRSYGQSCDIRRAVRGAVCRDDRTAIDRMGVRTTNYRAFLVY
jgi:hypothetical protein